jgi:type VI secretion system protein ImpF
LLDRLIDEAPEKEQDTPITSSEAMDILRRSVRRDIEALLNSRRRWRSWDDNLKEIATSPLNFGIPDCAGGRFQGNSEREALRREIEDAIRRFEPRFKSVRVKLTSSEGSTDSTLRLSIDAMLHAEPAPEPIAFETTVDPATSDMIVRTLDNG